MPHFCFRPLPQVSTLMEAPQGNTVENSGKYNLANGFKSPPERKYQHVSRLFCMTYVIESMSE